MHEMMSLEALNQRHEELLREAEMNRQARALRATGKRGAGRRSVLAWELKRHAGRLLKFLRALRNVGKDRETCHMSVKEDVRGRA